MSNLEKGIEAENYIADSIRKKSSVEIKQNHTWGVDITLKGYFGNLKIEVKSANKTVKKNGTSFKSGSFSFYPNNLDRPDFFAFVVNQYSGKPKTYWVKGDVIREHFKNRKRNSEKTKFTLGIPTLLTRIKKLDFSEVIDFE